MNSCKKKIDELLRIDCDFVRDFSITICVCRCGVQLISTMEGQREVKVGQKIFKYQIKKIFSFDSGN